MIKSSSKSIYSIIKVINRMSDLVKSGKDDVKKVKTILVLFISIVLYFGTLMAIDKNQKTMSFTLLIFVCVAVYLLIVTFNDYIKITLSNKDDEDVREINRLNRNLGVWTIIFISYIILVLFSAPRLYVMAINMSSLQDYTFVFIYLLVSLSLILYMFTRGERTYKKFEVLNYRYRFKKFRESQMKDDKELNDVFKKNYVDKMFSRYEFVKLKEINKALKVLIREKNN